MTEATTPTDEALYDEAERDYRRLFGQSALYEITSRLNQKGVDSGTRNSVISTLIINFVRLRIQESEKHIAHLTTCMEQADDFPLLDLYDGTLRFFERIATFEEAAWEWKYEIDPGFAKEPGFRQGLAMAQKLFEWQERLRNLDRMRELATEMQAMAVEDDRSRLGKESGGPAVDMVESFLRDFIGNLAFAKEHMVEGTYYAQAVFKEAGDNLSAQQAHKLHLDIGQYTKTQGFQSIARMAESMAGLVEELMEHSAAKEGQEGQEFVFERGHDWWSDGTTFDQYIDKAFGELVRNKIRDLKTKLNDLRRERGGSAFDLPPDMVTMLIEIQQEYYQLNDKMTDRIGIHQMLDGAQKVAAGQTIAIRNLKPEHLESYSRHFNAVAELFPISGKVMGLIEPDEDIGNLPAPFVYHRTFMAGSEEKKPTGRIGMRDRVSAVLSGPEVDAGQRRHDEARQMLEEAKFLTEAWRFLQEREAAIMERDVLNAARWEVIGASASPGIPQVVAEMYGRGAFAIPEKTIDNLKKQFQEQDDEDAHALREDLVRAVVLDVLLHVLANAPQTEMFRKAYCMLIERGEGGLEGEEPAARKEDMIQRLDTRVIRDFLLAKEEYIRRSEGLKTMIQTFQIDIKTIEIKALEAQRDAKARGVSENRASGAGSRPRSKAAPPSKTKGKKKGLFGF